MNAAPDTASKTRRPFTALLAAIALLFSLTLFIPWRPYVIASSGLDESWMLTLNALFARHPRFGHDLVFTYGPWGFLHTRAYHPGTFLLMRLGWAFFALAFWAGCWALGRERIRYSLPRFAWVLATLGAASFEVSHQSATLLCLIALLGVYYFDARPRPFGATLILLVVAVALDGLVKFTYLVAAGIVVASITVEQVRRRQFPSVLLLFLLATALFDLLAGQRLADFPEYLRLSAQITSGYADAMSLAARGSISAAADWPPKDLLCFIAGGAALIAVIAQAGWRQEGAWAVVRTSVPAGVLFLAFKWGFIRHDSMHAPLAAFVLLFIALIAALPRAGASRQANGVAMAVLLAAAEIAGDAALSATGTGLPGYYQKCLLSGTAAQVRAAAAVASGTSDLPSTFAKANAAIRSSSKDLGRIDGTVDVYPWRAAVATAHGWNYKPRPVLQSYSAYTEDLAELNVAALRGPDAPDHLVLSIADSAPLNRFPAAEDGLSWPEFLSRYEIDRNVGDFLVLKRSVRPRHFLLIPIGRATPHFGDLIPVPSANAGPIWMMIDVKRTRAGQLLSALYKSPPLSITVNTRDGSRRTYRVCSRSADVGFLLSPLINDNADYVRVAERRPPGDGEVTTICLSPELGAGQGWSYTSDVGVSFFRLILSRD